MLSTFNEIDMTNIMAMRSQYKDVFLEKHGVKLGFMSAFVKAAASALELYPAVNAVIDDKEIIYRDYVDISIAVATPKGLVVPVLRDVDGLRFADVEKVRRGATTPTWHGACSVVAAAAHTIIACMSAEEMTTTTTDSEIGAPCLLQSTRHCAADRRARAQTLVSLGKKARDRTLSIDEMSGGTFTISNGGVYGSLLSTPIINPPQSAIMGMHSIQQRPMVVDGAVVPRPMMYIAFTYDHRLIDGREVRASVVVCLGMCANCCATQPLIVSCQASFCLGKCELPAQLTHMGFNQARNASAGKWRVLVFAVQAVMFLRRVKDVIEDPRRLLLDI
jgi:2-oxoglutarate dehydrogenase E2 component (dihydrolipoamide succinyltransferase)